jgi:hypothetical protein
VGGAAVVTAEAASVRVGVASADAVVSLLGGVELAWPPSELLTVAERSAVEASGGEAAEPAWSSPELFTVPEPGSAVEASRRDAVELDFAPPLLFTVPDEEEPDVDVDDFVDESESDDGVLAADSDDELEADRELAAVVSVGSADATPGVLATAAPTPSMTAITPALTRCCAFAGTAFRAQSAR